MNGVKQVKKSKEEIATIDCSLITIETKSGEFGFDTSNQISVEPQVEEEDAVKLVVKGILRAQKAATSTLTGNQITLTDNVFNPELVLVLQGGKIKYDPNNPDEIVGYTPPVAGSSDKGEVFKLNAYTAQYDASGQIVKYERISYPNCQGVPVAFSSEDGAFRAPEYTINSAPNTGEAPYDITYVKELPTLVDEYELTALEITSEAGGAGKTRVTVEPKKDDYSQQYLTKVSATVITLPKYGENIDGTWNEWNGVDEITATSGNNIAVIIASDDGKALAGGSAKVVAG